MKISRKIILSFLLFLSFVTAGYIAAFFTAMLTKAHFYFLNNAHFFILLTLLFTLCIAPITQPLVIYLRDLRVRIVPYAPLASRTMRIVCSSVISTLLLLTGGWIVLNHNHFTNKMFLALIVGYVISLLYVLFLLIWNKGDSNA